MPCFAWLGFRLPLQIRQHYSRRLLASFSDAQLRGGSVVFTCSGTEANDLALRIAAAHRPESSVLVCMQGGYHGHSHATLAVSPYKFEGPGGRGARGAPGSVIQIALPQHAASAEECLQRFRASCEAAVRRGRAIRAWIYEPISGCGGQFYYPRGFLRECERIARDYGALCICDEVQVGLGRTGEDDMMWAFESQGLKPDIVTMGKPMGNGFPMAAVVATKVGKKKKGEKEGALLASFVT